MKTKPKLVTCALIFFVGGFLNLFFSTALHGLLSHKITKLSFPPLIQCLSSLVSSRQHFLLFLCIQGFFLLLAVLFFTTNLYPYKSDLVKITPEIQTPKAVGQYQHGSARWLTEEEQDRTFNSYVIDPNDKLIKSLIDSGYKGIDFIKKENNC
ncbi:MAG TPA: TRAG family protein [Ruminococcaceae bacterium]|nr:TRAG family protein [Oscillospiraceae bacterium]